MRRQWIAALVLIAAIAIGASLLVRHAPPRVEVGSRAPDFTAANLRTGRQVSLTRDYHGYVTLVNVWATYCEPCKQEIPAMDSLYRALGPRGFRIAAVSVDPTPADVVQRFADTFHISFDVLHDPAGRIEETYQTTGVPESFLVDRTGHIVRIAQRAAPWNSPENRRIVEQLLAEPSS